MIKDVLDGIKKPISSDMIVSKDPLEQKINVAVSIQYEDNISLLFNKTYAGSLRPVAEIPSITAFNVNDIRESYSHNLRPDIIITKDKETVFTAKMSLAEYLHGKMKILIRCILTGMQYVM